MQDKDELPPRRFKWAPIEQEILGPLPSELVVKIGNYLPPRGLVGLARVSQTHLAFFQRNLAARQLLFYLTRGLFDKAEFLVRKEPTAFLQKEPFSDLSGRNFLNISAFQYLLWALDKENWSKLLVQIAQTPEGKNLEKELLAQYKQLKSAGVSYELKGKLYKESRFDFENTIVLELSTQMESLQHPYVLNDKTGELLINDRSEIDKQWKQGVGKAQLLLPLFAVHNYCACKFFNYDTNIYKKQEKTTKYLNRKTAKAEDWFSPDSGLGERFAIARGLEIAQTYDHEPRYEAVCFDLEDNKSLFETNLMAYHSFEKQLAEIFSNVKDPHTDECQIIVRQIGLT